MAGQKIKYGNTYEVLVHEYIIDNESEISGLPTQETKGTHSWCNSYTAPFGSTALVVDTGKLFILGSTGWVELGYGNATSNTETTTVDETEEAQEV